MYSIWFILIYTALQELNIWDALIVFYGGDVVFN